MSKIICDICGTSYQDTAECCPICGCTRDAAASLLGEEAVLEEIVEETTEKPGHFTPKKKEIFDFDEVNADPEDEDDEEEDEEDDDYDEEEDEEEAPRHNTLVVILLTVLIAGLLLAAGFIFFRYFLPNMDKDEPAANTAAPVAQTTLATTDAAIPCEALATASATKATLVPGGNFLINVIPTPVDTTDKILYVSADESIATVSEDGKVTAVSEGTTKIFISCGVQSMECEIEVKAEVETVPPTTEAVVVETTPAVETTPVTETVPATEPAADPGLKNVVLMLKKTDIRLGVYYKFTLELDCDLEQNEVQWTSEHPHIATVDENGVVTAVKYGTTIVTAKYGDQEVQCWIRCV